MKGHRGGGHGGSVLVIGAGVSGLTSALCLARSGFQTTVIAEQFAPRVTSVVAGALWEWPPAVCGHHHDPVCLARAKAWCETSYGIFADLAADPAMGVFLRPVTFYFKRPVREDRRHLEKMDELRGKVQQFSHDAALIGEHGVNPELGLGDAYRHLAPMVDTDAYLLWLLAEVRKAGCRILNARVTGRLAEQEEALARQYGVDGIVNCTGLGARELGDDSVYPVRGALIRVRNDGRAMPRITQAHCVSHDGSSADRGFIFIVPRGRDTLLLGGVAEPGAWELDLGLDDYAPVREMYRRCLEFLPMLRKAEIDAAEPIRVGLRPFRQRDVRLEVETGTRIVHNYGHGGSGVTLSWGCALEVADHMAQLLFKGNSVRPALSTVRAPR
jgi:D-amino-acid oxidase